MAQEIPGTHLVAEFGQKALISKDGKVLMMKGVKDDRWDFPGGRLHIKEDLVQGLKRELMEELGVEANVGDPFFVTAWYGTTSGIPRVLIVYFVTLSNPDAEFVIPEDEVSELGWIGKNDIEKLNIDSSWKPALYKFFASLN
ncbi:NUDIX hydrolase [Candidatus Parcubacteria bacterium]|nr:NUDIX hydrolase [Candidatus Parcubacteria bacterium]